MAAFKNSVQKLLNKSNSFFTPFYSIFYPDTLFLKEVKNYFMNIEEHTVYNIGKV